MNLFTFFLCVAILSPLMLDHFDFRFRFGCLLKTSGFTHKLLKGAGVFTGDMAATGADAFKSLTNLIPGVVYLRGLADQKPDRDYKASIADAARKKKSEQADFVPTNR